MQARIQKWGNSLALRIPKVFATEAGLEDDALVEISLVEGKLVVIPIVDHVITLEQLLSGVTDENIHGEISTGGAMGKEEW